MNDEFGWLVELGCNPPQWWVGRTPTEFTYDANQAIRFARFEDAERARCWLVAEGYREGCKSLEHGWSKVGVEPGDGE